MRANRVGVLGHYYAGMLDVYSDLTQQSAVFGNHFELLEMCELHSIREQVSQEQVSAKLAQFRREFNVSRGVAEAQLARAARTSCALDALVERHALGSLAYYYEGEEDALPRHCDLGHRRQHALDGPSRAGRRRMRDQERPGDEDHGPLRRRRLVHRILPSRFQGRRGLLGHDGPAHFAIAEGRVSLVPLPVYHGKPGQGLSIQMTVRHGPVTLLAVVQGAGGKVFLLRRRANGAGHGASDRQHEHPLPLLDRGQSVHQRVVESGAGPPLRRWRGPPGRQAWQNGLSEGWPSSRFRASPPGRDDGWAFNPYPNCGYWV